MHLPKICITSHIEWGAGVDCAIMHSGKPRYYMPVDYCKYGIPFWKIGLFVG